MKKQNDFSWVFWGGSDNRDVQRSAWYSCSGNQIACIKLGLEHGWVKQQQHKYLNIPSILVFLVRPGNDLVGFVVVGNKHWLFLTVWCFCCYHIVDVFMSTYLQQSQAWFSYKFILTNLIRWILFSVRCRNTTETLFLKKQTKKNTTWASSSHNTPQPIVRP